MLHFILKTEAKHKSERTKQSRGRHVDSVRRRLGAERRQRGGKHQNLGLHEGQVRQGCDHFGRLLAQILVFLGLPVKTSVVSSVNCKRMQRRLESDSHLVDVLVFSIVDMSRAKASATRLPEPPGSSLAVVSSYSSGSTPEPQKGALKATWKLCRHRSTASVPPKWQQHVNISVPVANSFKRQPVSDLIPPVTQL